MNILDMGRNSIIHETLLRPEEVAILAIYANNDFIKDEIAIKELGIKNVKALATRICRVSAATGFKFERKTGYGYRLRNMLLINY